MPFTFSFFLQSHSHFCVQPSWNYSIIPNVAIIQHGPSTSCCISSNLTPQNTLLSAGHFPAILHLLRSNGSLFLKIPALPPQQTKSYPMSRPNPKIPQSFLECPNWKWSVFPEISELFLFCTEVLYSNGLTLFFYLITNHNCPWKQKISE